VKNSRDLAIHRRYVLRHGSKTLASSHPPMLKALQVVLGLTLVASGACAPRVDVARETASLLAADRAWSQAPADAKNIDSVTSYWTDDARVVMAGQTTVHGRTALREMVKGSMAIPGFKISWTPDSASVSSSGDLGYTFGRNSVTVPDAKGKLMTTAGRYLTVWRKGADGRWRCVMDYSTPGA
jgi:ketosteroid isomerase-like protein